MLISLIIWSCILFFLWTKVLKTYYTYWFYKRQGVATTGFPLPFIGNMLLMKKSLKGRNTYSDS